MNRIETLRDLQDVDSTLEGVLAQLDLCRAKLGDDAVLVPLRAARKEAAARVSSLRSRGNDLELDLAGKSDRLKIDEKKLYGGTVRNPKELSSLSEDVDHQKQVISRLEDKLLINMDDLEAATTSLKAAERDLGEAEAAWRAEQDQLGSRCASLTEQEAELNEKRRTLVSQIEPPVLRTYESIRRTRGGVAVVPIRQRTCGGCRITLSSAEVQRARSSQDPVMCQSCGRILYVP